MRTQEEILERIEVVAQQDWIGTQRNNLIGSLNFENAKQYLKEGVTEDDWKPDSDEDVRKAAIDYMDFAWDKAINCRGLSAGRSMDHYTAWLWLLNDNDLWSDLQDYAHYGKPQLVEICDYFGLDSSTWDDGVRVNSEDEL